VLSKPVAIASIIEKAYKGLVNLIVEGGNRALRLGVAVNDSPSVCRGVEPCKITKTRKDSGYGQGLAMGLAIMKPI
jgi:hypothetical protein